MLEAFPCRSCGQLIAVCDECPAPVESCWCACGRALCDACRPSYGKNQTHTTVKLFDAPKTMPGQMTL